MDSFKRDIERFLRTDEGNFDALSLELFHYQFEQNKAYQAYCAAQGIMPESVRRWQEIPAVPIGAFKSAELVTCPPNQASAVFESSATTTGTPSRHYLKTLTYYEASLKTSFQRHVLAGDSSQRLLLILTPPPAEAPHSSLAWMMDVVKQQWGASGSQFFIRRGRLDELWLATMLAKAQTSNDPVVLLGTTLAFLALFDYCTSSGRKFALPRGSRLMDTGGMKGQKREITRPAFVRQAGEFLGISEADCINEYGMCELSSQFYGKGPSSYLQGPAWTRTLVIDALTGHPARSGVAGLLRHFDLANVDSVMAIQTEDVGVAHENGFIFQGRDPVAEIKGCSLAAESFLR